MQPTETPYDFVALPSKEKLVQHFVGKDLDGLRTPALIIDRRRFAENCAAMHSKAKEWVTGFRAHLKTHKVGSLVLLLTITRFPKSDDRGNSPPDDFERRQDERRCSFYPNGGLGGCSWRSIQRRNREGCQLKNFACKECS